MLKYGGGELHSRKLDILVGDEVTLKGKVVLRDVRLEKILDDVKVKDIPIRLPINGELTVDGKLYPEFKILTKLKGAAGDFLVKDNTEPVGSEP